MPRRRTERNHLTRLRAVERYCEMLKMAQGKLPEPGKDAKRQMTWEELTELYQARQERERVALCAT